MALSQTEKSGMQGCSPEHGEARGARPLVPCKTFYATGVCEDSTCHEAKLHSPLAMHVVMRGVGTLKARMLGAIFGHFRPLAAVVTSDTAGWVIFGAQSDLDDALAWQTARFAPIDQKEQKMEPQEDEDEEGEDVEMNDDEAESEESAEGKGSQKRAPGTRTMLEPIPEDGFVWGGAISTSNRKDNSKSRLRECRAQGCFAVRFLEYGSNFDLVLDRTTPPHNHDKQRFLTGNESLQADGHVWLTVLRTFGAAPTTKSLKCAVVGCPARRRVKLDAAGGIESDELFGEHAHTEEEQAKVDKKRERDHELEAMHLPEFRKRRVLRRQMKDDGFSWTRGNIVLGELGEECNYQCTGCAAVRSVRWNFDCVIIADVTSPEHTHEPPVDRPKMKKRGRRPLPKSNWTSKKADGFSWDLVREWLVPSGRACAFKCISCPAVRTVTWGADLCVASDVTAPAHTHERPDKTKRLYQFGGIDALKEVEGDCFGWKLKKLTPLPDGQERCYGCSTCDASRVLRWSLDWAKLSDVTDPQHSQDCIAQFEGQALQKKPKVKERTEPKKAREEGKVVRRTKQSDGFDWKQTGERLWPEGRERTFNCIECDAVRVVEWDGGGAVVKDTTTGTHSHTPHVYALPYDGHKWEKVAMARTGDLICKMSRCGVKKCPARRKVKFDLNNNRSVVSDETIGVHSHVLVHIPDTKVE